MESKIFRKSSLEQLQSPEQLNNQISIIPFRMWCVLAGLLALAAVAVIWFFTNTVTETTDAYGIVYYDAEQNLCLYAYVPVMEAYDMSQEMEVRITPMSEDLSGFVHGKVVSVGSKPVSEAELTGRYGDAEYAEMLMSYLKDKSFAEVAITLDREDGALKWTGGSGELPEGSICLATIVTAEYRSYKLLN